MSTLAQLDENMIPGQTYTFQLLLENYITNPSPPTIQSDLVQNAPNFVQGSLQVTKADTNVSGGISENPLINWLKNYINIQFTYNGDGSDVISDVANELIASIKTGSNDNYSFVGAVQGDAQTTNNTGAITDAVTDAINKAAAAAGGVVKQATSSAGQGVQNLLTPVEIAIAVVVGLVVLLIFTSGKAGGVAAGPTGVNIGGSK